MSVGHMTDEGTENEGVARAMQDVLEAESAAAARISESRSAAAAAVQAARAKAEAIRRRADARMARMHASQREKIEAEIAAAQRPVSTAAASEPELSAHIASAVARLAVELTS